MGIYSSFFGNLRNDDYNRDMKAKKEFWSLTAVVFLAIVMPTILRQVNKVTRAMAGAEGRLASINIETDRILGRYDKPFITQTGEMLISPTWDFRTNTDVDTSQKWDYVAVSGQNLEPEELKYLALKFGSAKKMVMVQPKSETYLVAMGAEMMNTGLFGKIDKETPASKLFDKLGAQRLPVTGEGTWVYATAAKNANTYQVVIANYDPKGRHSEIVPVNFMNLETDDFEFRKNFLGSTIVSKEKISTGAGIIQKRIPMPANSVVFLELEAK